jgi:hypothetical protein
MVFKIITIPCKIRLIQLIPCKSNGKNYKYINCDLKMKKRNPTSTHWFINFLVNSWISILYFKDMISYTNFSIYRYMYSIYNVIQWWRSSLAFDSDISKSTNTVVYFDWKTAIYIYACGKWRTQFMLPMEKSVTFTGACNIVL